MTNSKHNNRHLNKELRDIIEFSLNNSKNFTDISNIIHKDRTTIAKEVKLHRFKKVSDKYVKVNLCINKLKCRKFDCTEQLNCYKEDICIKLKKPPYVCNACKDKYGCRRIKYYYYSKIANDNYKENLSLYRMGVNIEKDTAAKLNTLLSDLIVNKKQSINHIYINHPDELYFSKPTLYSYIQRGVFSIGNLDLNRKVRYKVRKNSKKNRLRRETAIRKGRTYQDYLEYISKNSDASIVEMDTVEGIKGGKVLLTFLIRKSKLMLIYIIDKQNMVCVDEKISYLKEALGIELFKNIFEVILTDNGSEFFNPLGIELDTTTGEIISNVFYCDPSASYQKGSLEKNHEFIRYVLPKKTSFNNLIQEDINLLMSHINSLCRSSLNNKCPYNASLIIMDEEILTKLKINKIKPDDVCLSPKLLKKKLCGNII